MKKTNLLFMGVVLSVLFYTSCKTPEDPIIPNEEEVITTLNFTLTPVGGVNPVVFSFQDLDGDGGNAPVVTGGTLAANTNYTGVIELLNELETPVGNITEDVLAEADEHQFFFQTTQGEVSIAYDDMDTNNNPLGLSTIVSTSGPSTGTITVILRHKPNKTATGVPDGDITNAGGETDIKVTFNVDIQ